jgi:DNA-binding response OmpR family regulator
MIDEKKPDLAIVDLMMPKIDGFGVLKGIQDRGFQDDFKVVISTNLSQNIDREKADKLGADDYFVKSNLSIKKMVDKVRENLSKN